MRSVLPTWPMILFGIIEPLALLAGAYTVFSDPQDYVALQVPSKVPHASLSANNTMITLQLGNVFLLLLGIAVLVCFFSDRATAKGYLLIVAFADLGHIYSSYVGMGQSYFWNINAWNSMAWGSVGFSAFLCVNRVATLLGVFGK